MSDAAVETPNVTKDVQHVQDVFAEPTEPNNEVPSASLNLVCSKCDAASSIVLFFNVNCQHVLCIKCLSPLGEKTQMKCASNKSCEALWTRKSTTIMSFIHPLFVDQIKMIAESSDTFIVDKSELDVAKHFNAQSLKLLKFLKPCLPTSLSTESLPVVSAIASDTDTSESLQNKSRTERSSRSTQEVKSNEDDKETSPPRKRSKREETQKDSAIESASSTVKSEKKPEKEKPQRNSGKKEAAAKRGSTNDGKNENEEDPSLKALKDNPLLQRPLASVENQVKYGSAANDPATYKKVMKKNFKGETKLHESCQRGLLDKAKEWLQMGSDPNTCDNASLRPIHEHGVIMNPELCQLLLEYGAEVNVVGGEDQLTPLHIAVSNNCPATAALLIKYGADINASAKDANGAEFTALSLAERMAKDFNCEELLKVVKETKREIFEPVVPPMAPICGPPPKPGKSIIFSATLVEDEKDLAMRFAEKFHDRVTYCPAYNHDCEALVCGRSKKINSYPPSVKILAAILTNGNLIDIAWMRECLSNRTFLDYKGYLLNSVCGIKGGVAKARESSQPASKKVFYGLKFYVSEKLQTFKYSELCLIIEIGDGSLLQTAPQPSVGRTLLNEEKVPEFLKSGESMISDMRLCYVTEDIFGHIEKLADGAYKVSPDWVVNCVISYSLPSNIFPQCYSASASTVNSVPNW